MTTHSESLINNFPDWFEYNNEIPLNTLKAWREEILSTAKFKFDGWTGDPKEPYRHWAYYPDYEGPYKALFECMNYSFKDEGLNLEPERVILNAFNHGDSSWLHDDCKEDNHWTALIFINEFWNINWGGDFVLVENNEILKAFAPNPGKFVLFNSRLLHGARPVSREAQFPRIGVAIQCINRLKI